MWALQRRVTSRSAAHMRPHTMSRLDSPRPAMARITSCSCSPMAGMPTSISGIPAAARAWAMASFSAAVNATPAVCSPSRRVVSLMVMVVMAWPLAG